jgi:hypothetical protein
VTNSFYSLAYFSRSLGPYAYIWEVKRGVCVCVRERREYILWLVPVAIRVGTDRSSSVGFNLVSPLISSKPYIPLRKLLVWCPYANTWKLFQFESNLLSICHWKKLLMHERGTSFQRHLIPPPKSWPTNIISRSPSPSDSGGIGACFLLACCPDLLHKVIRLMILDLLLLMQEGLLFRIPCDHGHKQVLSLPLVD